MSKILKDLIKITFLNPLNLEILLRDLLRFTSKIRSYHYHLEKGINWLILAFNKTKDNGVSCGYSLKSDWGPSYPETSGYILCTLIDFYHMTKLDYVKEICRKIADWELSIQLENGGFQSGVIGKNSQPTIFNTGQIILGLISVYREFHSKKYLDGAIKAGNFLVNNQENDGNWKKFCYKNNSHTYNVRVAWMLLELYQITKIEKYKEAAIKNLNWALTQKENNFWFKNNDPNLKTKPLLHFIAYTIRGFLESGLILNNEIYLQIAFNMANKLLDYFENHKILPARFNLEWISDDKFMCLPGIAQLSIIWFKLYLLYKDKKFLKNALKLNNYLKSKQIINTRNRNIEGAIKGSDPIWGNYMRFTFINWAAKFFCDALILENKIKNKLI